VLPKLRFAAGLVLAPVVVTALFWTQTRHYVDLVLPAFAAHLPAESLHSHSVPATFGGAARAVSAVVILAWCVAAFLRDHRAPLEVLAGALAVSTYVAGTSFDYNLVTVYPLLVVQLRRMLGGARWESLGAFLVLVLGLVAVTAHRGWFGRHATLHVALQIAWLLAGAVLAAARPRDSALQAEAVAR
jgi:hypothetical protein